MQAVLANYSLAAEEKRAEQSSREEKSREQNSRTEKRSRTEQRRGALKMGSAHAHTAPNRFGIPDRVDNNHNKIDVRITSNM